MSWRVGARLGLAALLGLLLGACGGDGELAGLEAEIAGLLARPPGPLEPLPHAAPYQPFIYDAAQLRSPFDAFLHADGAAATPSAAAPGPDERRPREALERFALENLTMVGSLRRQGHVWALLRDEAGGVHRITVGDYLGHNHGRVVALSAARIDLVELVDNETGGWSERSASLVMAGRD